MTNGQNSCNGWANAMLNINSNKQQYCIHYQQERSPLISDNMVKISKHVNIDELNNVQKDKLNSKQAEIAMIQLKCLYQVNRSLNIYFIRSCNQCGTANSSKDIN